LLPPPLPQLCECKIPDAPSDGRPHAGFAGGDIFGSSHDENEFVGLPGVFCPELAPEGVVGVVQEVGESEDLTCDGVADAEVGGTGKGGERGNGGDELHGQWMSVEHHCHPNFSQPPQTLTCLILYNHHALVQSERLPT